MKQVSVLADAAKYVLRPVGFACLMSCGLAMAGRASAQESPWTFRAGPLGVFWAESAKVNVSGSEVAGGDINVSNNYSLGLDVGYDFNERWTAHFAFGIPPKAKLTTAGSLDSMVPPLTGKLGNVTYGPAVLTAVYKFNPHGRIVPYVGAGVTYVHVFSTGDGDIAGLDVDDAWGGVLQGGFNVPLRDRWSFFFDLRKLFVDTMARGTVPALGDAPASVSVELDPLTVHTGIEYRF